MAISETKTRDRYTLDAVTTVFPITFNVVLDDNGNAKELAVYLIEDGVYTKLTRDADYTVSVLNVTYADAVNHAGAELLIVRATPLTQLIDFVTNGSYSLEQIEAMADKLTRIVQEQDTRIEDTETASAEAENAKGYAEAAEASAGEAETSAENADLSAGSADASAEDSEAYAVGQRKGVDVPNTDPTYHRNAKYYAELCARLISGGLRYQGTWDTTGATDYSALGLPRSLGDVFFVQGAGCTIDGVEYNLGDLIIINKELTDAITTADIDKIDNTETVTPDNTCPLRNKTIAYDDNTMPGVQPTLTAGTGIDIAGTTISAKQTYSTSEVMTGDVWINDRPIYRRVVSIDGTQFTKSTSGSRVQQRYELTGVSNIRPLRINGYFRINDTSQGTRDIPIGFVQPSTTLEAYISTAVEYSETTNTLYFIVSYSSTLDARFSMIGTSNFIIEYIKVES